MANPLPFPFNNYQSLLARQIMIGSGMPERQAEQLIERAAQNVGIGGLYQRMFGQLAMRSLPPQQLQMILPPGNTPQALTDLYAGQLALGAGPGQLPAQRFGLGDTSTSPTFEGITALGGAGGPMYKIPEGGVEAALSNIPKGLSPVDRIHYIQDVLSQAGSSGAAGIVTPSGEIAPAGPWNPLDALGVGKASKSGKPLGDVTGTPGAQARYRLKYPTNQQGYSPEQELQNIISNEYAADKINMQNDLAQIAGPDFNTLFQMKGQRANALQAQGLLPQQRFGLGSNDLAALEGPAGLNIAMPTVPTAAEAPGALQTLLGSPVARALPGAAAAFLGPKLINQLPIGQQQRDFFGNIVAGAGLGSTLGAVNPEYALPAMAVGAVAGGLKDLLGL